MVIAFNTNVFIYYFEKNPRFGPAAKRALSKLARKRTKGITSIISLIELLSLPQKKEAVAGLEELYWQIANLETVDVSREIGLATARIRREYGYRTSDAIQLATALSAKAVRFITNDSRLRNFKEVEIELLGD